MKSVLLQMASSEYSLGKKKPAQVQNISTTIPTTRVSRLGKRSTQPLGRPVSRKTTENVSSSNIENDSATSVFTIDAINIKPSKLGLAAIGNQYCLGQNPLHSSLPSLEPYDTMESEQTIVDHPHELRIHRLTQSTSDLMQSTPTFCPQQRSQSLRSIFSSHSDTPTTIQVFGIYEQAQLTIILRKFISISRVIIRKQLQFVQVEFKDPKEAFEFKNKFNGTFVDEPIQSEEQAANRFDRLVGAGAGIQQRVIALE